MRPRPCPGAGSASSADTVGARSISWASIAAAPRRMPAPAAIKRDGQHLGLDPAVAAAAGVAVVGGDDHRVLRQVDVGEHARDRAIGDPGGLAILGAIAAARVAGGVDGTDQQDHQVGVARRERAAGLAEPARPRRVAGVVERRREIGVGRAHSGLRDRHLEAVDVQLGLGVGVDIGVEIRVERRAGGAAAPQEHARQHVVVGRGRDAEPGRRARGPSANRAGPA